jgi:predicted Zn-dependent peptidase
MSSKNGSIFMVYMLAEPDADLDHLEAVVTEELANLAGNLPATDAELASYNLRSERSVIEGLEGLLARAESLQLYQFYTGTGDGVEADLQRHRDVTPDNVAEVIQRYLTPERGAVLRVLPLQEVEEETEAVETSIEGGEQ